MDERSVDKTATFALASELLRAIECHYLARPATSDTVCEVLNALAFATALVLSGTGGAPEALQFFDAALACNLNREAAHG